ncbi:MAG: hypothetical protein DWQ08_09290, partial [Proteobacteria bacterium]
EAWSYWAACVPVVVIGAPLGALFIRNRSRHFVAAFLYLSIGAQYLWALAIIEQTVRLTTLSLAVLAISLLFYYAITRLGRRRRCVLMARAPGLARG